MWFDILLGLISQGFTFDCTAKNRSSQHQLVQVQVSYQVGRHLALDAFDESYDLQYIMFSLLFNQE